MSADNGIYILPVVAKNKTTYRVAHAQAIDNISYQPDRADGYSNEGLWSIFSDAKSFDTIEEAVEFAGDKAQNYSILEYGICELEPAIGNFFKPKQTLRHH